jgi:Cu+-exporting ATPase
VNIDVPIALGIAILFIRSAVDIIGATGSYLVPWGLVFFLLIGRLFRTGPTTT